MMKSFIVNFRKKGLAWFAAVGAHVVFLAVLAGVSVYVFQLGKERENPVVVTQREFQDQEYDETLKRAMFKTPRIEGEKMGEKPILILEEEVEITKDISKGTSFDNIANKNLGSTSCIDSYGIGGGRAGAYGQRWGKGSMATHKGSVGAAPAHGGSKPPNAAPYDAMFLKHYGVNPEIQSDDKKLSTFGIDVDTASYTLCRRYITDGHLPPEEAVRVEEFVNFFNYDYEPPKSAPFAIHLDAAPTPFAKNNRILLRIGLKAREVSESKRKKALLTFVVDTSGSMSGGGRLEMVKEGLKMLVSHLRRDDTIAIIQYKTQASLVLERTSASELEKILSAISQLRPSGSTNVYEGLKLGYRLAEKDLEKGCINRIILCSDGVANEAHTDAETILKHVAKHRRKGITLFCVGVGMGNYNDVLLEKLGDKGDGHYAYIDKLYEAKRVFIENITGTLQTVARDTKVQVEFNPETVVSFRLLGYENRRLKNKDFRNDKVDAGEVGAGHSVTALYVVKIQPETKGTIATVRLRWQDADTKKVTETEKTISTSDVTGKFDRASKEFKLAAVVAQFTEILRKSYWANEETLKGVVEIAESLSQQMKDEKVSEFNRLVKVVAGLKEKSQSIQVPFEE
jgi:Ca-activated chloride channel family protein